MLDSSFQHNFKSSAEFQCYLQLFIIGFFGLKLSVAPIHRTWSDCTDCLEWGLEGSDGGHPKPHCLGSFGAIVHHGVLFHHLSLLCQGTGSACRPLTMKGLWGVLKYFVSGNAWAVTHALKSLNIEQKKVTSNGCWMDGFLESALPASSSKHLQKPGANPKCSINSKRAAQGVHRNYKHRTLSSCIDASISKNCCSLLYTLIKKHSIRVSRTILIDIILSSCFNYFHYIHILSSWTFMVILPQSSENEIVDEMEMYHLRMVLMDLQVNIKWSKFNLYSSTNYECQDNTPSECSIHLFGASRAFTWFWCVLVRYLNGGTHPNRQQGQQPMLCIVCTAYVRECPVWKQPYKAQTHNARYQERLPKFDSQPF